MCRKADRSNEKKEVAQNVIDKFAEAKFHEQVIADAKMFLIKHKNAFAELAK